MKTQYRIAVADDERDTREFLAEVLERGGHKVVGSCANGDELAKTIREQQPELVVADIRMPHMDGIDTANLVNRDQPVPFILVSAHHDPETVKRATASHVFGYLVKPICEAELRAAVTMAMARFDQFQTLLKETADLRQALDERKMVEKAKGVVMKRSGVEEEEAYRRLRKSASHQNVKMIEVCRRVIAAEEVFQMLDQV